MSKDIIILGGPNGAGKTTAARELLPKELDIREFVNADEIARGLSPFNEDGAALTAGRIMLKRMHDLVATGESFAFETTCAGKGLHSAPATMPGRRLAGDVALSLAILSEGSARPRRSTRK